ncbi:MAG: hypothetical protein AAGF57_04680 [Pseudomonadota bacterium]
MNRGTVFIGMLMGVGAGFLLAFIIGYSAVERNRAFANENMTLYFAAMDDIAALEDACGVICADVPSTNRALFRQYYPDKDRAREN